jgi:hypothetical protein
MGFGIADAAVVLLSAPDAICACATAVVCPGTANTRHLVGVSGRGHVVEVIPDISRARRQIRGVGQDQYFGASRHVNRPDVVVSSNVVCVVP